MIMSRQSCGDSRGSCNDRHIDLVDLNYLHASDERHRGEREFRPCDDAGKRYSGDWNPIIGLENRYCPRGWLNLGHLSFALFILLRFCMKLFCSNTKEGYNRRQHKERRRKLLGKSTYWRSHHYLRYFLGNLCTFHRRLLYQKCTWIAVTVAAVGFRVNTDHIGDVGAFDIDSVEHLLTNIVKFVGEDPSLDSNRIISFLASN
jgi:hypothetical protein